MLTCVKHSMHSLNQHKFRLTFDLFKDWDFRFNLDSQAATLFSAWEQQISLYLHETTLDSADVRLSLHNHPSAQSAFYVEVRKWAKSDGPLNHPMCKVEELRENSCQEFMLFTLEKALR